MVSRGFTASELLKVGVALALPVLLDDCDKPRFKFTGTIERVHVKYLAAKQGISRRHI